MSLRPPLTPGVEVRGRERGQQAVHVVGRAVRVPGPCRALPGQEPAPVLHLPLRRPAQV